MPSRCRTWRSVPMTAAAPRSITNGSPYLGEREDVAQLGQAEVVVAAEGRVDHVVGENASLLGLVPDPAHGPLGQRAGLGHAQVDPLALSRRAAIGGLGGPGAGVSRSVTGS